MAKRNQAEKLERKLDEAEAALDMARTTIKHLRAELKAEHEPIALGGAPLSVSGRTEADGTYQLRVGVGDAAETYAGTETDLRAFAAALIAEIDETAAAGEPPAPAE